MNRRLADAPPGAVQWGMVAHAIRTAGLPDDHAVAGVDEAGRGPLAGPVVAAAVMFRPGAELPDVADSKTLSAKRRDALFDQIHATADVGVASAEAAVIDQLNIHHATLKAMAEAVANLPRRPRAARIDGKHVPQGLRCPGEAIVGGDASDPAIAAASIVAKVMRDRIMIALDARYPGYGFAQHKGYPTAAHRAALARLGPTPHHRRSFGPVARAIACNRPDTGAR